MNVERTSNWGPEKCVSCQETYFKLYNQSPDMHASVDSASGRIVQCNETLLDRLGRTRNELIGSPVRSIYHESCLADFDAATAEFATRGSLQNIELVLRRADGSAVPVILSVSSIRDTNGKMIASYSVWREFGQMLETQRAMHLLNDELEARVAERTMELIRRNTDLEQFAQVASHDLKAPLHGIRLAASWLQEDCYDLLPEQSRVHLDLLQQRVERMDQLLRGILEYAQAGRDQLSACEVDTNQLCQRIAGSIERPSSFAIHIDDSMPTLFTFQHSLQRVFQNLITNGVKHRDRDDGSVTISHRVVDGIDEFAVADDGPGIDPRFHAKVFEMFQTLRPRDAVEGSGLGLSIVKRLVEDVGGTIKLESSSRGTTFRFTWPRPAFPVESKYREPDE